MIGDEQLTGRTSVRSVVRLSWRLRWIVLTVTLAVPLACRTDREEQAYPPAFEVEMVELGERVYARSCASCHGPRGEGAQQWSELDARGELPPPPHNAEGHTWRHPDGMLYRIVRGGWRDPFNATDRLTMPAFGDTLTPEETRAVITYLKTWWTPEQRDAQWRASHKDPFPDTPTPIRP